jgi:hypothetical protein
VASILTIGPVLLAAGPAAVLVFLACLNRSGPGEVCTTTKVSEACTQEYSPWPFLAIAILLLAAAVALAFRLARRDQGGHGRV